MITHSIAHLFQARLETKNFLQSTISRYYSSTENTDAVSLMWNHLMAEMRCCGVENYKDFELSEKWKGQRDNRIVPEACCVLQRRNGYFKPQDESCPYAPSDTNSHFNSVSKELQFASQFLDLIILKSRKFEIIIYLLFFFCSVSGMLWSPHQLDHWPSKYHCDCWHWRNIDWNICDIPCILLMQFNRQISCHATLK